MNKRYVLEDREVLTPEAIRAILAKESLIGANQDNTIRDSGNLITASGGNYYRVEIAFLYEASDSAEQAIDENSALLTMLASENVLRREWDNPEEDAAWADLLKAK